MLLIYIYYLSFKILIFNVTQKNCHFLDDELPDLDDIAQQNDVYQRLLNKTKHIDDISIDECMKIASSEIDVEMITTEESTADSGFLPDLSQNQVFKKPIKIKTL